MYLLSCALSSLFLSAAVRSASVFCTAFSRRRFCVCKRVCVRVGVLACSDRRVSARPKFSMAQQVCNTYRGNGEGGWFY